MRGAQLSLGAFEPGRHGAEARLHGWPAGPKILGLLVGSLLLSLAARTLPAGISLSASIAVLALVSVAGLWGGFPVRRIWQFCAPAMLVLLMLVVADVLLWRLSPGARTPGQSWSEHALRLSAQIAAVLAMVLAARLLSATTRVSSLLDALTRSTRLLAPLGFRPDVFALTVSIVIRSIPVLGGSVAQMRAAHTARGLRMTFRSALSPVAMGTIATTISTAEALAARMLPEDTEAAEEISPRNKHHS